MIKSIIIITYSNDTYIYLIGLTAQKMQLNTALVYDSVLLISEAFKQLDIEQIKPKKLSCINYTTWENGNSITNFMRNVKECKACGVKFFCLQNYSFTVFCTGTNWTCKVR